ncbi:PREDICTED: LETM1 domain-containing protein 1 [Papilio xuthus]|uniref:LETM1 domain-containing protein 1 n=2 Tax=Papilio xuthus TaxID=66420 RepID=A0AAJ7EIW3_PAPXU|nr:PREDICTED: LETM1 domain-containing protein 1 [Papilio xuthus]
MIIHRMISVSRLISQCNRSSVITTKVQLINLNRHLTNERLKHTTAFKSEKDKIRTYIVQRYINYVKNYKKLLQDRFPTAIHMYRVFSIGIKDFLSDLKTYISLRLKITKDQGFSNMTREEIELFVKMPSDMWRIAPVLILSALPFGNYIIFPLALMKPKKLLSSHFWSIQQRAEFNVEDLKERLRYNRPILRCLQAKLELIPDSEVKENWRRVLALLGSGVHPSVNEVLACKELFCKKPYHLAYLSYTHMGHLLKMLGIRRSLFRRKKLKYRAFLLLQMDRAIEREGGVDVLTTEALKNACHIRGLNTRNLANQDMKDWLQQWISVSSNIDANAYSLLLHCPIFFAYNHPQNWVLIY